MMAECIHEEILTEWFEYKRLMKSPVSRGLERFEKRCLLYDEFRKIDVVDMPVAQAHVDLVDDLLF